MCAISYFIKQNYNIFRNLIEFIFFIYKRNGWMLDITRFFKKYEEVKIQKPIFLLGTEGGGLTIISRMLRRYHTIVSVSGNCDYWSGADEMQLVLGPILPAEFTGIRHSLPKELEQKGISGNCLYASDRFLPYYRKKAEDVSPELRNSFRKIIRWQIVRHAINQSSARFIDKSQVFTVKLSFLNEILKDTDPKFVLITRNPYVIAFSFAKSNTGDYIKKSGGDYKDALKMAAQHWRNSIMCAFEDSKEVDNFFVVRLEDILEKPEENLRKICDFVEIDFNKDLLPQSEHKIPFGSKGKEKWYPLRPDINEKYFRQMSAEDINIIDSVVYDYARKLNYYKPNL